MFGWFKSKKDKEPHDDYYERFLSQRKAYIDNLFKDPITFKCDSCVEAIKKMGIEPSHYWYDCPPDHYEALGVAIPSVKNQFIKSCEEREEMNNKKEKVFDKSDFAGTSLTNCVHDIEGMFKNISLVLFYLKLDKKAYLASFDGGESEIRTKMEESIKFLSDMKEPFVSISRMVNQAYDTDHFLTTADVGIALIDETMRMAQEIKDIVE